MSRQVRLIQMINGLGMNGATDASSANRDENAHLKFLNLGFKLAPTADQNNHQKNWGNATTARTGIITTSVSKANVISALRSRYVYATEDKKPERLTTACAAMLSPRCPRGANSRFVIR